MFAKPIVGVLAGLTPSHLRFSMAERAYISSSRHNRTQKAKSRAREELSMSESSWLSGRWRRRCAVAHRLRYSLHMTSCFIQRGSECDICHHELFALSSLLLDVSGTFFTGGMFFTRNVKRPDFTTHTYDTRNVSKILKILISGTIRRAEFSCIRSKVIWHTTLPSLTWRYDYM